MSTATHTRPTHRRIHTDAGEVRITRWAEGTRRRSVYLVLPDASLIELGTVVNLGGRTAMAYPAIEGAAGWGCESYVDGARLLAARLEVQTLTLHTVHVRTTTETEA